MSNAVEDILYLGKRLKGIMELSDKLTTQEALENHISDLNKSLEELKANSESMRQKALEASEDYSKMLDSYKKNQKTLEAKAQETIDKAQQEASAIISKAQEEANKIVEKGKSSVSSIEDQIVEKKKALVIADDEVISVSNKIKSLKDELEALKNRFS